MPELRLAYEPIESHHIIRATDAETGEYVGLISWPKDGDGHRSALHVEPPYRRQGIGTRLWMAARNSGIQPRVWIGDVDTDEGRAFIASIPAEDQAQ